MKIYYSAGPTGLEPAIFSVTGKRGLQLLYGPTNNLILF